MKSTETSPAKRIAKRPVAILYWNPLQSRFYDGVSKWRDLGDSLPFRSVAQEWAKVKGVRFEAIS
jgi:hypothetical protein